VYFAPGLLPSLPPTCCISLPPCSWPAYNVNKGSAAEYIKRMKAQTAKYTSID
jgi:hypothetical protein